MTIVTSLRNQMMMTIKIITLNVVGFIFVFGLYLFLGLVFLGFIFIIRRVSLVAEKFLICSFGFDCFDPIRIGLVYKHCGFRV